MSRTVAVVAWLLVLTACAGRADPAGGGATAAPTGTQPGTTGDPTTFPAATFVPRPPPPGSTVCDSFTEPVAIASVENTELTETSGIAASRSHPGVFWLHNDSGGAAAVYAVDADGNTLGTWVLDGVTNLDWEDIGIGPGPEPGVDYLYVGDIGDNLAFRPDVSVQRFPEPDPAVDGVVNDVVTQRFGYPGGPVDAEALAIDPIGGQIVVITKTDSGRASVLVASTAVFGTEPIVALADAATLDLGAGSFVTAVDISPDGTLVAARGYEEVWMWGRTDRDLAAAFAAAPCAAPSPLEVQGEALAFTPDGTAYVTVSEGTNPTIWEVGG